MRYIEVEFLAIYLVKGKQAGSRGGLFRMLKHLCWEASSWASTSA